MSASINVLGPRSSLLDRRASNNIPDLPDQLSVADLLLAHPPPSSSSLLRGVPKKPSAGFLPFIPLTPIMASPLLTPDIAHAPTPAAVLESATKPRPGHGPSTSGDYLNHHPSPPNPVWMTSPPTPPLKNPSSPGLALATPSSARPVRHRSKSTSRNAVGNRAGPRPVSMSYPTYHSCGPATSSSTPSTPAQPGRIPVRRFSLPSDLSKPLPPPPSAGFVHGAPKDLPPVPVRRENPALIDSQLEHTILPSLSRRAPASHGRGASLESVPVETDTLRVVGKKLFNLDADEGDLSDEDELDQRAYKEEDRPARREEVHDPEPRMGQTRIREQEKARAERLRRYHALMELLTTEVGYLLDLRALVTVYLDQLLNLSSSPPTPLVADRPVSLVLPPPPCIGIMPPPRTLSSFSALSIPSLFPNPRSSVLQPQTSSYNSNECPSDKLGPQDRERHPSGASDMAAKERDREKENLDRTHPLKVGKPRQPGPILIEREVRAVCRNAQELLRFHERFVSELRDAMDGTGFRGAFISTSEEWARRGGEESATEGVERAVAVVAAKFVNEAASFNIYETFCPGHAAATDLVRRAQERWPSVWDAYEQRCAHLISVNVPVFRDEEREQEASSPTSPVSSVEDMPDGEQPPSLRRRRTRTSSTPALSFAFPASPPSSATAPSPGTQLPFPSSSTAQASSLPGTEKRSAPRLKFMDYLIKPVQRICKYPLLLDQLLDKRRKPDGKRADDDEPTERAVRRAGEAMRGVVDGVNSASEKEAHNLRSALIASRISFSNALPTPASSSSAPLPPSPFPQATSTPSSSSEGASSSSQGHSHSNSASSCSAVSSAPTSPASSSSPRPTSLTADFVSSLGPCMLAGALDVIEYPSHRAKYMGVFLYSGGYCILAKVTKGGRVYEPRHWFSFSEVEVVDVEEDDASFPFSFRVSGYGHHLELAASCTQEKSIWMAAINDSLSTRSSWRNEPLSSLQADDKAPLSSGPLVEEPQELAGGLPTIQSLSDLEKHSDAQHPDPSLAPPTPSKLRYSRTLSRLDSLALMHEQQPSSALSRRSSTASVKAFFSLDPMHIQRPSAQARAPTDHGLHDVFSESCTAARAQALMRGDELFQPRVGTGMGGLGGLGGKRQGSGVSRSNSGISLASAMGFTAAAAKRKYDMVSRRNRSVDLDMSSLPSPSPIPIPIPSSASARSQSAPGPGSGESDRDRGHLSPVGTGEANGMRAKTLAVRRHKKQPASIGPAISTAIAQMNADKDKERDNKGRRRASGANMCSPSEAMSLDSPPDVSHSSSVSSALPSPVDASPLPLPIPIPGNVSAPGLSPNATLRQSDVSFSLSRTAGDKGTLKDASPKRARSMVHNVRHFFHAPRAADPASSDPDRLHHHASPALISHSGSPLGVSTNMSVESPPAEYPTGIVQWLRRTSIRRRPSGSSSGASTDDRHSQVSAASSISASSSSHKRPLHMHVRNSSDGIAVPRRASEFLDVLPQPASASPGRLGFDLRPGGAPAHAHAPGGGPGANTTTFKRHRSLFVSSSRSRDRGLVVDAPRATEQVAPPPPPPPSAMGNLSPRKSIRKILRFQRSTSMTPCD